MSIHSKMTAWQSAEALGSNYSDCVHEIVPMQPPSLSPMYVLHPARMSE